MTRKANSPTIQWSSTDRARHKALRERFAKERPSKDHLLKTGEYVGPLTLGDYLEIRKSLARLKKS